MALKLITRARRLMPVASLPSPLHIFSRSVWSMKKDPDLENALSRNRRWIVNNQIKHFLLRSPDATAPVKSLQKRFKTLDLQGKALNWLRKYPCCFETFAGSDGEAFFRLTKRMAALVEEEEAVRDSQEPEAANRLVKLLMLSRDRRLNVVKLSELKRGLGFPDDYVFRFATKYPNLFKIVNNGGKRNSMEIELAQWDDKLAVSAVESVAIEEGTEPRFSCLLPPSWIQTREKFDEFNDGTPYVSPYSGEKTESEKRAVGMVHELLSLTLWKKASILKLGHFRREFGMPQKLNVMLLRHPCIFYVSNRYKIYTVVLREGYCGSELVCKDPLVVAKDKFGDLMQEGLHEYNRRRCMLNLEKKRKKGEIVIQKDRVEEEASDDNEEVPAQRLNNACNTEERRRFYKALFNDNFP